MTPESPALTRRAALVLALLCLPATAAAQVGDVSDVQRPGWEPADRVEPTIRAAVSFDSATSAWRYRYTVLNGAGAEQDILEVWFRFDAPPSFDAFEAAGPDGWDAIISPGGEAAIPGVTFAGELAEEDADHWLPSPDQIPPGDSLTGFEITSAYPPGEARTYVRGYVPLPFIQEPFGGDQEYPNVPHDTTNAQRGWSVGPTDYGADILTTGRGQRADVDSLLAFLNLDHRITRQHPTPVALRLAPGSDPTTLRVELNRVDVTDRFGPGGPTGADLVGFFTFSDSPLQPGRNVLLTVIEGAVTQQSGRVQVFTDRDRIQFTVEG